MVTDVALHFCADACDDGGGPSPLVRGVLPKPARRYARGAAIGNANEHGTIRAPRHLPAHTDSATNGIQRHPTVQPLGHCRTAAGHGCPGSVRRDTVFEYRTEVRAAVSFSERSVKEACQAAKVAHGQAAGTALSCGGTYCSGWHGSPAGNQTRPTSLVSAAGEGCGRCGDGWGQHGAAAQVEVRRPRGTAAAARAGARAAGNGGAGRTVV
jgi:hypothetical protein